MWIKVSFFFDKIFTYIAKQIDFLFLHGKLLLIASNSFPFKLILNNLKLFFLLLLFLGDVLRYNYRRNYRRNLTTAFPIYSKLWFIPILQDS